MVIAYPNIYLRFGKAPFMGCKPLGLPAFGQAKSAIGGFVFGWPGGAAGSAIGRCLVATEKLTCLGAQQGHPMPIEQQLMLQAQSAHVLTYLLSPGLGSGLTDEFHLLKA
eukprot:531148-Pelagomonas_calceolata.AAC.9